MTAGDAASYAHRATFTLIDRGGPHLALLLHGLGGDRTQPLGLTPDRLEATGADVLAPDARGHGDCTVLGAPERFTLDAMADDVADLIEHLALADRRLILVGISMGAAVALRLIRREIRSIDGALLIRPSFGTHPWPPHLEVFRLIADLLRSEGPAGEGAFVGSEAYKAVEGVSPAAAESLVQQFRKPHAAERVTRLEVAPGEVAIDWSGRLATDFPVVVVGAEGDPQHPVAMACRWHEHLEDSELVVVPSRDQEPERYAASLAWLTTDRIGMWTGHT